MTVKYFVISTNATQGVQEHVAETLDLIMKGTLFVLKIEIQ